MIKYSNIFSYYRSEDEYIESASETDSVDVNYLS